MKSKDLISGIEKLKDLVEKREAENRKMKKIKDPNKNRVNGVISASILICPVIFAFSSNYQGVSTVASILMKKEINRSRLVMISKEIMLIWIMVSSIILLYEFLLKPIMFSHKIQRCQDNLNSLQNMIDILSLEYDISSDFLQASILKNFLKDLKNNRACNLRDCINYYMDEVHVNRMINSIKSR